MGKIKYIFITIVLVSILVCFMYNNERNKDMLSLSSGDDNSHWYHSIGIILKKDSSTLTIKIRDNEENVFFKNEKEILLFCEKCKSDLEHIQTGDTIKFYFFKHNVDETGVKVEKILLQ